MVINQDGTIQFVNKRWIEFAVKNGGTANMRWNDNNYLQACDYLWRKVFTDG